MRKLSLSVGTILAATLVVFASAKAQAQDDSKSFDPFADINEDEGAEDSGPSDEEKKKKASELIAQGNTHLRDGDFEAALSTYQQAYDTFPSSKIRLNLAEALKQLGRFADALKQYEQFLVETDLGPEDQLYGAAESRADELRGKVAYIQVTSNVTGAEVSLNGKVVGPTPLDPIPVDAGNYTVRAEMVGYEPFESTVSASSGDTVSVELELKLPGIEKPMDDSPPLTAKAEKEESGGVLSQWWFWTAIAVVAAGGVGVAVAASSGGDDFVPGGELGLTGLSEWERF